MTHILTHRGLDPSRTEYFAESSYEAFRDQLARGFGLEFDVQFIADGGTVIFHDGDLRRISGGRDVRKVSEVSWRELSAQDLGGGCRFTSLPEIFRLIRESEGSTLSALHLKHAWQTEKYLSTLLELMKGTDVSRFIIFDLLPEAGAFLRSRRANLQLAPSVAHPYDKERYNGVVGGTLMAMEEVVQCRGTFDWVWLDEWDRADRDGGSKTFYTKENMLLLRKLGFNVGLVSPELHRSSPGLLGGEAHADAANMETLRVRMADILALAPDIFCTDYPDLVRELNSNIPH